MPEALENVKMEAEVVSKKQLNHRIPSRTGSSNSQTNELPGAEQSGQSALTVPASATISSIDTTSNTVISSDNSQRPLTQEKGSQPKAMLFVENLTSFAKELSKEIEEVDEKKEIASLCDACNLGAGYFYFDRDPVAFAAIANFYRTDALHLPGGVCFRSFQEDLFYWGINLVSHLKHPILCYYYYSINYLLFFY